MEQEKEEEKEKRKEREEQGWFPSRKSSFCAPLIATNTIPSAAPLRGRM